MQQCDVSSSSTSPMLIIEIFDPIGNGLGDLLLEPAVIEQLFFPFVGQKEHFDQGPWHGAALIDVEIGVAHTEIFEVSRL